MQGRSQKLPKVPPFISRLSAKRLTLARANNIDGEVDGASENAPFPKIPLSTELAKYLRVGAELDVPDFWLPHFWWRKSLIRRAEGTGEVLAEIDMLHLTLDARLYAGANSTSCQTNHIFSALTHMEFSMSAVKQCGTENLHSIERGLYLTDNAFQT